MGMRETLDKYREAAVSIGLDTYGKELDYSDESIHVIDEILDGYHERYLNPEMISSPFLRLRCPL